MYENPALCGINQGALNFCPVKAKNHNFNAFFGLFNAFDQTLHTVAGLNKEFHEQLGCSKGDTRSMTGFGFLPPNHHRNFPNLQLGTFLFSSDRRQKLL